MIDNLILGILVLDKPIYAGQYHSISFNICKDGKPSSYWGTPF